jgi:hypothetical protein
MMTGGSARCWGVDLGQGITHGVFAESGHVVVAQVEGGDAGAGNEEFVERAAADATGARNNDRFSKRRLCCGRKSICSCRCTLRQLQSTGSICSVGSAAKATAATAAAAASPPLQTITRFAAAAAARPNRSAPCCSPNMAFGSFGLKSLRDASNTYNRTPHIPWQHRRSHVNQMQPVTRHELLPRL